MQDDKLHSFCCANTPGGDGGCLNYLCNFNVSYLNRLWSNRNGNRHRKRRKGAFSGLPFCL